MEQRAMTRAGPGYESRGRTDFEIFELRLLSLNPNRLSRIFKRHPGGQHGREHRIPAPVARQQPTGRRPSAPAPITMLDQADTQPDKFGVSGLMVQDQNNRLYC